MATSICKFDAQLAEQLQTTHELPVYSVALQGLFTAAWYDSFAGQNTLFTFKYRPIVKGVKLTPRQLVAYLQEQGLHFPCFCSKLFNIPYAAEFSVVIDSSRDEQSYAYCHFSPPRCSYFVDLLKIYQESETVLTYPTGALVTQRPYIHGLWVNYFSSTWAETGPYVFQRPRLFLGFLGEPNRVDLPEDTRTKICRVKMFTLQPGQVGPKHMVPRLPPLLPPQAAVVPAVVPAEEQERVVPAGERIVYVEQGEADPIMSLCSGIGLPAEQYNGLFQTCAACHSLFLTRFLEDHKGVCQGPVV
ncbi:hypothetical protein B0H11DRAFT_1905963 [Mycena galericulata]|nr:hypothetical protein B0H11DRAFT_1905963 [Mycena galericulata]